MSAAKEKPSTNIRFGSLQVSGGSVFLLACILFAFAIRYFFIPQDSVINSDGVYYTILGERFVSGDLAAGISAYWSPLYSVLTGFSSLLFTEREFAGRFVSLVAGSLLIIPAYFLIREFFGSPAAYVGSILLVFHPFLIKSSGWVMTESVYTLILTTCVLSCWYALTRGDSRVFLITGLLMGAAFLTKPEAIGYLVLMLGLMLAAKFFGESIRFPRTVLNYLVLLLGFAFLVIPYCFHLHHKTGKWTLSQKIAFNLPAADYEGDFDALTCHGRMTMKDRIWGDDYETECRPQNAGVSSPSRSFDLERLGSDVLTLGTRAFTLLRKQLRVHFPAILPIPFAVLAVAGFFCGRWTRTRVAKDIFLFSFVLCTVLGYAASTVELRYLFPIIPLLIAWVAHGVIEFSEWLARSVKSIFPTRREVRPALIAICVVILLLGWSMPLFFRVLKPSDITSVPFEEKDAGLWIKEHSNHVKPIVISSNITPAFYANAKHLYLPAEELSTVVEYARFRQADYLVFSERRKYDAAAFVARNGLPRDLNLVYHDQQYADFEVMVYQLIY